MAAKVCRLVFGLGLLASAAGFSGAHAAAAGDAVSQVMAEAGAGRQAGRAADDKGKRRNATTDSPAVDAGLQLRASDELSVAGPSSERRRELLRLEQRTLQMRNDGHHDQQALNDKIGWLEADVGELTRAADRLQGEAAALSTPVSARPPADVARAAENSPVTRATLPAEPAPASPPSAPAAEAGAGRPPMKPVAKRQSPPPGLDPDEWATYAGLAAAALLVSLLIFRRQLAPRRAPLAQASSDPTTATVESGFSRTLSDAPTVPIEVPAGVTPPSPAGSAGAPEQTAFAAPALARLAAEPELTAAATALDLAEIMLSFGRVTGAAKTLQEYVTANPQEALRPWIRLLQIYQDNGMREEFEAMALKLNRNFNVEIIRWQGDEPRKELELLPLGTAQQAAVTLEEIPHIRGRIVSLWGSADCGAYLEQLLRDNRDGQRSGFALPVVEEVLFLIDLLAAREAVQ